MSFFTRDRALLPVLKCQAIFLIYLLTGNSSLVLASAKVVVISPHTEAIRSEFGQGFNEWHRKKYGEPATVDWREVGGTTDALKFVQSEFSRKPAGIGIDCFFGGGQEPFLFLKEKQLCLRYQPPEEVLRGIPKTVNGIEIYDPEFSWFGAALSSFGILQNTRVQRLTGLPLIHKWSDLAQPSLIGRVGAGDPRNSGTMNVMFEALLQAYGWEKGWEIIVGLAGNARKFDRISSATAKDVTLGETVYGMAVDFYAFTQLSVAGKSNLTFVLPEDGSALNPDCLALLRGAPNLITAQRFVNFVLSEEGQQLWFLPRGYPGGPKKHSIERMTVRPDFYKKFAGISNIEFSPFDLNEPFRYDSNIAKARRETLPALLGALLIDTHRELQQAWKHLSIGGVTSEEIRLLAQTPVSEKELNQLGRDRWKEPAFRNTTRLQWQTWAQEKYRRIIRGNP